MNMYFFLLSHMSTGKFDARLRTMLSPVESGRCASILVQCILLGILYKQQDLRRIHLTYKLLKQEKYDIH